MIKSLTILLLISVSSLSQSVKILYVDDFDKICGIQSQEDSLFAFTAKNGFNSFYLYDLNTVTQNKAGKAKLGLFIERAHLTNIQCIGIGGTPTYLTSDTVNSRKSYQDSQTDPNKKLDGLNFEKEFWRYPKDETCTFPQWINTLANMQEYCASERITGDFYIGQLNDKEGQYTDAQIAKYMVKGTKRILLSDYVTTAQFIKDPVQYVKTRLTVIGTEAAKQNKIIEVVIMFNGDIGYMHKYFKSGTPEEAYAQFIAKYNRVTYKGKANIRMVGYAAYSYQELRYTQKY